MISEIKKMFDRSECKKMLVWKDGRSNDKHVRLVIDILKDDACIAIFNGKEEDFLNNRPYITHFWDHCEPIPEQTKCLEGEKNDYTSN